MVFACACGRLDFDPLADAGSSSDGGTNDSGSNAVCGAAAIPNCPEGTITASRFMLSSDSAMITTSHGLSSTMCGSGNGAPEVTYVITPTNAATYMLSVIAPPFTAYYVLDGCCGGAEIDCGVVSTPLMIPRTAGQTFTVVIEGTLGSSTTLMVSGI